jgi:hypothetical protein
MKNINRKLKTFRLFISEINKNVKVRVFKKDSDVTPPKGAAVVRGHIDPDIIRQRTKSSQKYMRGKRIDTSKKRKDYSFDPKVIEAYSIASRLVKKYGRYNNRIVTVNRPNFVESHVAQRIHERVHNLKDFENGLEDVLRNTTFMDDLAKNAAEYAADRMRKYGPQLISDKYKFHAPVEVIRRGKKDYEVVFKTVIGDWNMNYMHKLANKTLIYRPGKKNQK